MALLAHLYSHIRGSQEDVATYSLQYLLSSSDPLNQAFTQLVAEALHANLPATLNYTCQASGENQERPDVAGTDADGNEVLLCEAKFYAGLTENQPNAYLDRVMKKNGTGLVFICPAMRKHVLWSNLKELVEHRSVEVITDSCITVDGVHMSMITWAELISVLRRTAASVAVSYLSDVDQLESFCLQMDSEAFIPFSPEDMGPDVARREERYYQVVDRSPKDARIGKALLQCGPLGYITEEKYRELNELDKWQSDMEFAEQIGLVRKVDSSRFFLMKEIHYRYDLLNDTQRKKATEMYNSFGNDFFSTKMLVATLSYTENVAKAVLHTFRLLRILDCRKDGVNMYQFRVNPEENPECFESVA